MILLSNDVAWPGKSASAYLGWTPRSIPYEWFGSLVTEQADASGLMYRRNWYYDPKVGRFTQPDPIGIAGGLNSYGFASGDPVNYTDPFGLCTNKKDGSWRPCRVTWSSEASNTNISKEAMEAAQAIADLADVDLTLSSGRRAEGDNCDASRHNCGKAFDINAINEVDIGQGTRANPAASALVERVQGVALGMSQVRENYGPMGLWKSSTVGGTPLFRGGVFGSVSFLPDSGSRTLWFRHQNHVHIGVH